MKAIVCLDDRNGMCFNRRRQSSDRVVTQDVLQRAENAPIWMNGYSAMLFGENPQVHVAEDFLEQAPMEAWCFVEDKPLQPVAERIETLVVYRWNRHYPSDVRLDLQLEEWQLMASEDFAGHSHEKITREEYKKQ